MLEFAAACEDVASGPKTISGVPSSVQRFKVSERRSKFGTHRAGLEKEDLRCQRGLHGRSLRAESLWAPVVPTPVPRWRSVTPKPGAVFG